MTEFVEGIEPELPFVPKLSPPLLQREKSLDERLGDLEAYRGILSDVQINKMARDIKKSAEECAHLAELVPTYPLRIARIQTVVARNFNVSLIDMLSARRTRSVILPRQIAMYLCKLLTLRSLTSIGRQFNRDHTTVLHAVRKIEGLIEADAETAVAIAAIKAALS